jgi:hypothetical protein
MWMHAPPEWARRYGAGGGWPAASSQCESSGSWSGSMARKPRRANSRASADSPTQGYPDQECGIRQSPSSEPFRPSRACRITGRHHAAQRQLFNRLVGAMHGCLKGPHQVRRTHRLGTPQRRSEKLPLDSQTPWASNPGPAPRGSTAMRIWERLNPRATVGVGAIQIGHKRPDFSQGGGSNGWRL